MRIYGEKIKEGRLARDISLKEFAETLGITRQMVSLIEKNERNPSQELISKISILLSLPTRYFYSEDSINIDDELFLFRSMSKARASKMRMQNIRMKWLFNARMLLEEYLKLPQLNIMPNSIDYRNLDDEEIDELAQELRDHWKLGKRPINNLTYILEKNGFIISTNFFKGENFDASSGWIKGIPFIFLSANGSSAVRNRFSIAHELGHLILHRFVDQEFLGQVGARKKLEKQANRFASAFLMPEETFRTDVFTNNIYSFIDVKRKWKVSIGSIIYRCKTLEIFSESQIGYLNVQLNKNKWRMLEPLDDEIEDEQAKVLSLSIKMLFDNSKITLHELEESMKLFDNEIEAIFNLRRGELAELANQDEVFGSLKLIK